MPTKRDLQDTWKVAASEYDTARDRLVHQALYFHACKGVGALEPAAWESFSKAAFRHHRAMYALNDAYRTLEAGRARIPKRDASSRRVAPSEGK